MKPCNGLLVLARFQGGAFNGVAVRVKPLSWAFSSRYVGTQTPLHRLRREAEMQSPPRNIADIQSPLEQRVRDLIECARRAAADGEDAACVEFIWKLRDNLPYGRIDARGPSFGGVLNARCAGNSDMTLLQTTAAAGLEEATKLLVEDLRADVRAKTAEEGLTPLHLAAKGNHAKVARVLLSRGRASVDARDSQGRTPLMLAADLGHRRTARVLARFGADPSREDSKGKTPMAIAEGIEGKRMSKWLDRFVGRRKRASAKIGAIRSFKGLGTELPAHIVAPELRLTPVGYCPYEDGEIKQLRRGIRVNKKRPAPSSPRNNTNWYAPRG